MSVPITVLVVDDHKSVRRGLHAYLDTQPDFHVVGEAGSGEEAVESIHLLAPGIVLLDMFMPGMNGVETTREIKRINPRTQVVILTFTPEDKNCSLALEVGATFCFSKDKRMDDLVDILRVVADRVVATGAAAHFPGIRANE